MTSKGKKKKLLWPGSTGTVSVTLSASSGPSVSDVVSVNMSDGV